MTIFFTFVIAFLFGYIYGHKIKPNQRLRRAIQSVKEECAAVLDEGNRGVYKTIVTDDNGTSELVVEIKELATTEGGQVKVQYLSAFYKNPAFRTRKGDALIQEVRDLLGDYLPLHEIEWYESSKRHDNIKQHIEGLNRQYKKQYGV